MQEVALPASPSLLLQASFVLLALGMTTLFVRWTGQRSLGVAWLLLTGAITLAGGLQDFSLPPRLVLLVFTALAGLTVLAWRSDWHTKPLGFLVGYQAFRILVEFAIHRAVVEGVAPPQLSWEGRNFDIVTGVGAALLAPFAHRLPVWALHAWNAIGLALLVNVVSVAILSFPTSFQVFQPANIWVVFFPFSWLPLVLVMMAWLGHVVLFKRLLEEGRTARTTAAVS